MSLLGTAAICGSLLDQIVGIGSITLSHFKRRQRFQGVALDDDKRCVSCVVERPVNLEGPQVFGTCLKSIRTPTPELSLAMNLLFPTTLLQPAFS